jgi:hypothetical protein
LGLRAPSVEAAGADCLRTGAFFVDCLRAFLATGGWSSRGRGGLGLRRRKTEGEGIWMSSAMSLSLPLAVLLRNRTLVGVVSAYVARLRDCSTQVRDATRRA